MKTIKQYTTPEFKLVRQDESNRVFFTASGGPSPTSVTGGINTMTVNTSAEW